MSDLKQIEASLENLTENAPTVAPGEIVIGEFCGFDEQGRPTVTFPNYSKLPVAALSTVAVTPEDAGRRVAILFANGSVESPVIMGLIHSPLLDLLSNIEISPINDTDADDEHAESDPFESVSAEENSKADSHLEKATATIDGKRVVLEGKDEIEIRCGEASIRLTKEGKILIRGKYLLNRSTGVNRIMGGSVQVN